MLQTSTPYARAPRRRPPVSHKRKPYRDEVEALLRKGYMACSEIAALIGCGSIYVRSVAFKIGVKPCLLYGPRVNRSAEEALAEAATMLEGQWLAQQRKWGFR